MSSTVIGQILHFCLDICKMREVKQMQSICVADIPRLLNLEVYAINANSQLSQRSHSNNRLDLIKPRHFAHILSYLQDICAARTKNSSTIYRIFRLILSEEERASPTRGRYKSRRCGLKQMLTWHDPKTVCYRTRSYITPVIPALVHHRSRHVPTPGIWISKEKNLDDSD